MKILLIRMMGAKKALLPSPPETHINSIHLPSFLATHLLGTFGAIPCLGVILELKPEVIMDELHPILRKEEGMGVEPNQSGGSNSHPTWSCNPLTCLSYTEFPCCFHLPLFSFESILFWLESIIVISGANIGPKSLVWNGLCQKTNGSINVSEKLPDGWSPPLDNWRQGEMLMKFLLKGCYLCLS